MAHGRLPPRLRLHLGSELPLSRELGHDLVVVVMVLVLAVVVLAVVVLAVVVRTR